MEPVYAIVLAIVFFHEQQELHRSFYLGVVIILGVVFAHSLLLRSQQRSVFQLD